MENRVFKENEKLSLTPEKKLETWRSLIHKKIEDGNIIKIYADIESTGLEFTPKGRPAYEPSSDYAKLDLESKKFNIPIGVLVNEAKESEGKQDRMIEIALVFAYENANGETFILKDEEGEEVYFHEMILPTELEENKNFHKMPLVPYQIHKTSFEFLRGEEEHPFLKIKLNKPAANTVEVLTEMLKFFQYPAEKLEYYKKIQMFFHNGDKFDVPFIDSELYKIENSPSYLRNFVQIYDTIDISREIIPNEIQKFLSYTQGCELLGGDKNIKDKKEVFIQTTQKNLDNITRIAKFVCENDLSGKIEKLTQWQKTYYKKIHDYAKENQITEWEGLLQYICHEPIINTDILKGAPKLVVESEIGKGYVKFRDSLDDFLKNYEPLANNDILKNIINSKNIFNNKPFLKEALDRINELSRESHGARVDSQLFMDAFIIIENIFYPKSDLAFNVKRKIDDSNQKVDFEEIKRKFKLN